MDFLTWRRLAREGVTSQIHPDRMRWSAEPELFTEPLVIQKTESTIVCPPKFLKLAQTVACHRDERKWDLLYRMLWTITCGRKPRLLDDACDPHVRRAEILAKQVSRDIHKMTAFVRFQKIRQDPEAFAAWYEPDHFIMRAVAPFFTKRFGAMNWVILTPDEGAVWNQKQIEWLGRPLQKPKNLNDDCEETWKTYFSSIFNPARLKIKAMKNEMPVRYWKNLPEAALIPSLIADAGNRMRAMVEDSKNLSQAATPTVDPGTGNIAELRDAVKACSACELCGSGRPGVPSVGPSPSSIVIVGEQPGDQEDLQGKPFVGPAGQLLHELLAEVGAPTNEIYFTNAVKHFRFVQRGKLRLHMKPQTTHIKACRPWLERELKLNAPRLIIALGATATHSVLGYALPVREARERLDLKNSLGSVRVTFHPSAILRAAPDVALDLRNQLKRDLANAFETDSAD